MPKRYSVAEAKNHLPALLHEAERGDAVEITRHGQAVAVVLSLAEYHRLRDGRPDLWDAYVSWKERHVALTDEDVDALADPQRGAEPSARIDW